MTLPDVSKLWASLDAGEAPGVLDALNSLPDSAPVVYRTLRGLAFLEVGKPEEAASLLRNVLGEEPENPVAQLFLVLALFRAGKDREAGDWLLNHTILHPHRGFLFRFLETFWPLRFTTSLGRGTLDQSPPVDSDPHAGRFAKCLDAIGEEDPARLEPPRGEQAPAEAVRHMAELRSPEGRSVREVRSLAADFFKSGTKAYFKERHQQALRDFRRAWQLRPLNEQYAAHYAYLELLNGNPETAQAALEPFLRKSLAGYEDSHDAAGLPLPDTVVCYAWCLHESGRHEDALRVLAMVHPEGPEDYGAYFVATVSWLMAGDEKSAAIAFQKSMTDHFIDTWEQLLRPFVLRTSRWLADGGRDHG